MSFVDTEKGFEKVERAFRKQDTKPTTYSVNDGLFQINSYTNEDQKDNASSSQTIQFDANGLKKLITIIKSEFPSIFSAHTETQISKVKVSLFDNKGNPQYGLNWGQRVGREPNQAYIQLPIDVYRSDFFPKKPIHFNITTDDGKIIIFTRAQKTDEGTALQTPEDNSLLGRYLRTRMNIPLGAEITRDAILKYGCTEIIFFKVDDKYFMDFSGNPHVCIRDTFERKNATSFILSKFNKNNDPVILRYVNALLAKPFVILTGNSGTGKTRIAKRFAEYLGRHNDRNETNFLLVPVGADWTDNTKILGYNNPLANNGMGEYEKTNIFAFIERASANPNIPFFLILDEMNLSHVERYFSDFLSKMELQNYATDEKVFFDITGYGKLELPKNLFITGTVNIDETTYMFSPKVLDRANVIEFKPEMDNVLQNLLGKFNYNEIGVAEDGFAEGFMQLANKVRSENVPQEMVSRLEEIKSILEKFYTTLDSYGFEFAYRTTKEIRLYAIATYETAEGNKPTATEIADVQILQKILPKIHGNKKQIGELLDKLDQLCETKALTLCRKKIIQMKDKLNRFQYASFI